MNALIVNQMATSTVKLVIVDDHLILTEFLADMLSQQPDFTLVGRAGDGMSGLKVCLDTQPDLVLVDVAMPAMDGLEMIQRLRSLQPDVRTLVFSGHNEPYTIWRVAQSRAHGYLEKSASFALLLEAMRTVSSGKTFFSPQFQTITQERLTQEESFTNRLTRRELQILLRVVEGWADARIASELEITAHTVMVHCKNMRKKLRLHNVRQLITYAKEWGIGSTIMAPGLPTPPQPTLNNT